MKKDLRHAIGSVLGIIATDVFSRDIHDPQMKSPADFGDISCSTTMRFRFCFLVKCL